MPLPQMKRLAYLRAGPLENLLRHRGPAFATPLLDEIDEVARRNRNFRMALRCVWWDVDDDPARVERFQRFGPPL